ncbi:MAG TPA: AarF/ABC1/UbiB kinase family protein [Pseudonocardia sp.]
MTETPRQGLRRNVKLGSLPIGFAGRGVAGWARRVAGADRHEIAAQIAARNADQLFAVLGELKGGAMKVGQLLSVYEALIPSELAEPYRQALIKLQAEAPAMPRSQVHRVLAEQLGADWPRRFAAFDDGNAHAASIGQVHRAVWHDGREVAVKLQYPGAEEALRADLRTLRRLARLIELIVPGADVRAVLSEITEGIGAETDYLAEADNQRSFASAWDADDRIRIPKVVASSPRVIVSEWLEGIPLSNFVREPARDDADQRIRDHIGEITAEFLVSSPSRVGLLHCDPHPGNFRLLPDGRIGVLDFGAVTALPGGFPRPLGLLVRAAMEGDKDLFLRCAREQGFIGRIDQVDADDAMGFLGAFTRIGREERFHFNRAFLQAEGARLLTFRGDFQTIRSLDLPPEYVMVVRTAGGWLGILGQIGCTVPARSLLHSWIPELTE